MWRDRAHLFPVRAEFSPGRQALSIVAELCQRVTLNCQCGSSRKARFKVGARWSPKCTSLICRYVRTDLEEGLAVQCCLSIARIIVYGVSLKIQETLHVRTEPVLLQLPIVPVCRLEFAKQRAW